MTLTDPLCSLDDLQAAMSSAGGSVSSLTQLDFEDAINAASRAVEQWCGREFYPQTAATARVFGGGNVSWDDGYQLLKIDDCWSITSVASDDSDVGTYSTTWASTTYQTLPLNGRAIGISGHATDALRFHEGTLRCRGARPVVQVTAKWGWAAVPSAVGRATRMVAADLVKRKEAPFGVAGFGEFGSIRVSPDLFRQVSALLAPFCRVGGSGLGGFA